MNNYGRMSYNFGPTLLSWLHDKAPRTYRMILDADKVSAQRYSGHGSAMAQVYNHIIMPLASRRDALTQIRWGIADFEFRLRPQTRRHVARRNRRQPQRPRSHGPGGHQVHRSRPNPVRPRPPHSPSLHRRTRHSYRIGRSCGSRLDRNPQRHRRPDPPLSHPSRRRPLHRRLLLRRTRLPRHRL